MATRAQRKFKQAKRAHHQKQAKSPAYGTVYEGSSLADFIEKQLEIPLTDHQLEVMRRADHLGYLGTPANHASGPAVDVDKAEDIPTRAKCPVCSFSHKVRKNGTMSRHDVFVGSEPETCKGTGLYYR